MPRTYKMPRTKRHTEKERKAGRYAASKRWGEKNKEKLREANRKAAAKRRRNDPEAVRRNWRNWYNKHKKAKRENEETT